MHRLQVFEFVANEPGMWFGQADTLLKAAARVWPERNSVPNIIWVALMLRGYAVEDLVKGLWLQTGNRISGEGKFLGIRTKSSGASGRVRLGGQPVQEHNLVALYEELGETPGGVRRDMLRSLTTAILHLGRYPIPRNHQQFPIHRDEDPDPTALWCSAYEKEFWVLVRELASAFNDMKEFPPDFLRKLEEHTWRLPDPPGPKPAGP